MFGIVFSVLLLKTYCYLFAWKKMLKKIFSTYFLLKKNVTESRLIKNLSSLDDESDAYYICKIRIADLLFAEGKKEEAYKYYQEVLNNIKKLSVRSKLALYTRIKETALLRGVSREAILYFSHALINSKYYNEALEFVLRIIDFEIVLKDDSLFAQLLFISGEVFCSMGDLRNAELSLDMCSAEFSETQWSKAAAYKLKNDKLFAMYKL